MPNVSINKTVYDKLFAIKLEKMKEKGGDVSFAEVIDSLLESEKTDKKEKPKK